ELVNFYAFFDHENLEDCHTSRHLSKFGFLIKFLQGDILMEKRTTVMLTLTDNLAESSIT
ncbi:hypothetical protein ACQP3J_33665, partial [Escherichia coli]